MRTYAGIGSRETPAAVCEIMTQIADWLRRQGYTLRSGAADGADAAFEAGAGLAKQVFVPWKGFNGSASDLHEPPPGAATIAAQFHPAWDRCSRTVKKLHTRNVCQVLGPLLGDPVDFVACWTKDGRASGGTGQALRIAVAYKIPVFNLHDKAAAACLHQHVSGLTIFA